MTASTALVIWALLAQIALTMVLYIVLSLARREAVNAGGARWQDFTPGGSEPAETVRLSRSLMSQFELPVIFYALVVLLVALNAARLVDVVLAWIFVGSRLWHAHVHTRSDDVGRRGRAFMVGIIALLGLALHVAILAAWGIAL